MSEVVRLALVSHAMTDAMAAGQKFDDLVRAGFERGVFRQAEDRNIAAVEQLASQRGILAFPLRQREHA